jgi:hypothetical protein
VESRFVDAFNIILEHRVYRAVIITDNMSVVQKRPSPVTETALRLPIFQKLANKRVVLASSSPRRKDILETAVSSLGGTTRVAKKS